MPGVSPAPVEAPVVGDAVAPLEVEMLGVSPAPDEAPWFGVTLPEAEKVSPPPEPEAVPVAAPVSPDAEMVVP